MQFPTMLNFFRLFCLVLKAWPGLAQGQIYGVDLTTSYG